VSWLESLRGAFSFFATGTRGENRMAQYVIREHHRGRALSEILADPYVVNRCSHEQIDRLLDRPEVVHAIGEDMIDRARVERATAA
jgi:hypothetical protein